MSPIVLITRPEVAAQELAQTLRQRWAPPPEIVISPILKLEFLAGDVPLSDVEALIFTSRNGVAAFARITERRDIPCYVVGNATLTEAERHGLKATLAGKDGDELCAYLTRAPECGPFLHLHGEHVAGDVAGQLRAAGRIVSEQVVYKQMPQAISDVAARHLAGSRPILLPFFSPRSAKLFFRGLHAEAPLLCAAMSPKVAENVPAGYAARLEIAQYPDLKAMLDSLDLLREYAIELESLNRAQ